jgi:hypothetical protein
MRGGLLVASCNGPSGLVRTSIDPRTCRGGDIVNSNGQLACNGGYTNGNGNGRGHAYGHRNRDNENGNNGYGNNRNGNDGYGNNRNGNNGSSYGNNGYGNNGYGAVPTGSYQQSCTNAVVRGGVLTATCPGNGGSITTSIGARSCNGGDIANVNGRLQCR